MMWRTAPHQQDHQWYSEPLMLERLDEELARAVDLLTRLIEPLLMSVIGLIIGVIVVLMYFPIFELAGSLQ